ncbi:mitochondrial distribution and morphology family 33, partial [Stereum hirsutum FP-91666 SS1]|uniref:mitochondrial distribution and morphology family 33 n=1 Tax=Stereum hirsutum (strain FP-91666) TaxID=721885 RepID=UPI000444A1FC
LRELAEQKAIALRHQTDHLTQSLSATFSQLGGRINKVTGYDEIDALKKGVVEQEARITAARTAAREAKLSYEAAVEQRSSSQREVNDLLQRKSSWKTPELTRFMELIQEEHIREQEEARSKNAVRQTEEEVEKEFNDLLRLILARYHEEQVWSDKIRSVSTYGSMAVLGVNVFVFLLAIILVEPWKRKRLAQTFEKKVEELAVVNSQAVENGIGALRERLDVQEQMLSQLVAAATMLQSERES